MGRFRDAWRVLRGKAEARSEDEAEQDLLLVDERYIRRDEVRDLVAQMADLELSMASHFDKLNSLAARLRKRDQRAAATETPPEGTDGDPGQSQGLSRAQMKAALARKVNGR